MAASLAATRSGRFRREAPRGDADLRHRELVRLCDVTARGSETPGIPTH
jgi:hypothetical protein